MPEGLIVSEDSDPLRHELVARLSEGDVETAQSIIRTLCSGSLRIPQYQRIGSLLGGHPTLLKEIPAIRLAVLGGFTTQPIIVGLTAHLFGEGFWTETYEAEFNTYEVEVRDPQSGLFRFGPDYVLFALGIHNIRTFPEAGAPEEAVDDAADRYVESLGKLWDAVRSRTQATIIQHTFDPPGTSTLGRHERKEAWSRTRYVEAINDRIWARDGSETSVLDTHQLAIRCGTKNWLAPRWYHHSKHGFDPVFTSEYCHAFAGLFRALRGRSRKCLCLDLDGVLWGGILGESGVEGVSFGNGSPEGEAHLAFCEYVRALKERGIVLCLNSKNREAIVRDFFAKRGDMPLQWEDFAAVRCNYDSKSANLREMAAELNLSPGSFVFVDDSPVECAEVRSALPSVTVLEMSGDPADFPARIDRLSLFDQVAINQEDLLRAATYGARSKAKELAKDADSLEAFLDDLEMVGETRLATIEDIPRSAQLINKTNQFNTTGMVVTEEDLRSLDPAQEFCLVCTLRDRFADYGIISASVCSAEAGALRIKVWVMSCRVFSRTVEAFIAEALVRLARERGLTSIIAEFESTAKNEYAAGALEELGFIKDEENVPMLDLSVTDDFNTHVVSTEVYG